MKAARAAIAIIALTAAAIAAVMLPRILSRPKAHVEVDRAVFPERGVDISAHNGDVDFSAMAADGVTFVFLKATEGASWRDSRFETNYAAAEQAGLRVGAYHFFRFDVEGWRQSVNIIGALGNKHLDLPVAIDVEEWTNPTDRTTEEIIDNLRSLVELLRQNGREPMIYTNKNGYYRFVRDRFDDVALWICSFTDPAMSQTARWDIWQHSHRGTVRGVQGAVDLNTFNTPARGPMAEWYATVPALARIRTAAD